MVTYINQKHKIEDFEILKFLGKGSFSEVFLVNYNKSPFVLKCIKKNIY